MKKIPSLFRGLLTITSLVFLSTSVLAHDQVDLGSWAALLLHFISAPDHVPLLVIGLVAVAWVAPLKFSQRASAKSRQSKRRQERDVHETSRTRNQRKW